MSYDYKEAKANILETLNSKVEISNKDEIPDNESLFNFQNGVKAWVGSIFVDMVDSTSFFIKNNLSENVKARIMRSFVEQIVTIMNENENCYDIGIRGDCVFGIFQANTKEMIVEMFRTSYCINAFMKMFNELLTKKGFPRIKVGIGIGSSPEVIIKVGKKRVVNDKIWIGDAVVNASNLSKIANRNWYDPICMDPVTYNNIIDILIKEEPKYKSWIRSGSSTHFSGGFYQCDIVQTNFNDWIDGGMK
jgi:hypothetical protein